MSLRICKPANHPFPILRMLVSPPPHRLPLPGEPFFSLPWAKATVGAGTDKQVVSTPQGDQNCVTSPPSFQQVGGPGAGIIYSSTPGLPEKYQTWFHTPLPASLQTSALPTTQLNLPMELYQLPEPVPKSPIRGSKSGRGVQVLPLRISPRVTHQTKDQELSQVSYKTQAKDSGEQSEGWKQRRGGEAIISRPPKRD